MTRNYLETVEIGRNQARICPTTQTKIGECDSQKIFIALDGSQRYADDSVSYQHFVVYATDMAEFCYLGTARLNAQGGIDIDLSVGAMAENGDEYHEELDSYTAVDYDYTLIAPMIETQLTLAHTYHDNAKTFGETVIYPNLYSNASNEWLTVALCENKYQVEDDFGNLRYTALARLPTGSLCQVFWYFDDGVMPDFDVASDWWLV